MHVNVTKWSDTNCTKIMYSRYLHYNKYADTRYTLKGGIGRLRLKGVREVSATVVLYILITAY